jgi:SpoIIAA-like
VSSDRGIDEPANPEQLAQARRTTRSSPPGRSSWTPAAERLTGAADRTGSTVTIVRARRVGGRRSARFARTVDPYIEATGDLRGLIVEASAFPGWDGFGAMAAHFRFVRDHHERIKRIAIVTDAPLGNLVEKLASHFVAATSKHFPAGEIRAAEQWINSR